MHIWGNFQTFIFRVVEVEGKAVGVVVATGMGEVEGMAVEEVRVMEQEGVGGAQGMEVGKAQF